MTGAPQSPSPTSDPVLQAVSLLEAGKTDEAVKRLRTAAQRHPREGRIAAALADVLYRVGQAQAALFQIDRALALTASEPAMERLRGQILQGVGRHEDGLAVLRAAHARWPEDPALAQTLVSTLDAHYRLDECEALCLALRGTPAETTAIRMLHAALLHRLGRSGESAALLREIQAQMPSDAEPAFQLATLLNYEPGTTPQVAAAAQRRAGMLLADHLGELPWPAPVPTERDRHPLRVGILSPDLRTHSVPHFAKALVLGLKQAGHRVVCYHVGSGFDEVTKWFVRHSDALVHLPAAHSLAVATRIREDRTDVLFELAGLTSGHRQTVNALRPAPVQVTAIGYPATTGNPAINYRIVDSLTDPAGAEALCSERLVRLDPCFLCYTPPEEAVVPPARTPIDPASTAPITFGCFNAVMKLSRPMLAGWGELLRRVPGSTIVVKGSDAISQQGIDTFGRLVDEVGLPRERLRLLQNIPSRREHLAAYHGVDIALDSWPYNGTTTTCEALLMGVPVVSFAGAAHAGRVGLSLLSAVGVPELCAADADGYVRVAAELAGDRRRLSELHGTLRARLLSSPLSDVAGYGRRVGEALRGMWSEACDLAARG